MQLLYFGIWIILCAAAGLAIGLLRGNLPLGITLIPLFVAPFAYVCCFEMLAVICLVLFVILAVLNAKKIWRIWTKKCPRARHPRLWVSIPGTVIVCLVCMIFWAGNAVISALLVPEFMEKLDAFEEVTEQSYSELVHTDDITANHKKSIEETNEWLTTVEYEHASIETADGYTLNGVVFYGEESEHNWVLLAHGYTGWKEEMYPNAYWYNSQGYHCVVPDCRCSGSSEGDFIGMGYLDSLDMRGWIDYILELDPEANILLHGQSMGGATVLLMAGQSDLPDCVIGVVSDCAFSDAYEMFETTGRNWLHLDDVPDIFLEFVCLTFRLRGGYDFHKASPISVIDSATVPILYIHGDADQMISVDMTYDLYDKTVAPKELLIMEGAGHTQSQDKDPKLYYGTIEKFIRTLDDSADTQ